ncbi:hypothetical protein O181_067725 [Austropuccinia psidii MF-1]|uniref:Dynein light intermediate chain n=1 Tax=Austropuccinia psidii MF-1 TaxID=1389203 RepID=A0A9Q3I6E0_9BASI|nr:hypothetical protein [Austropuccinia psidii MF-1]
MNQDLLQIPNASSFSSNPSPISSSSSKIATSNGVMSNNPSANPIHSPINSNQNLNQNQQQTVLDSNLDQDSSNQSSSNLWSSILDSVSSVREKGNIPLKRVIILGDPQTGKSTVASYLSISNPPPTDLSSNCTKILPLPLKSSDDDVDLGTSFTTVDIGDEGDDDPLARLLIHQIPSALPPYSNLLPLILNRYSLRQSLILVLIPFTHPHSLLTSFVRWLVLIQSIIDSIKQSITPTQTDQPIERGEYLVQEAKEALESQYRSYLEPVGDQSTNEASEPNSTIHLDLPLPPGTLTENMGIGIVVVCTKSDQIDQLEKEKDFKEEQFDFIQQVLRSICLRFGGSLFFTSDKKPDSLMRLRSYVLHRLFGQLVSATTSATGTTPNARLFPFPYKANVVDRDEVLIPMGWDSWGKIKILRDGFDPLVVGNGWLFDLQKQLSRRPEALSASNAPTTTNEDDQFGWDSEGKKIVSACKLWEDMIGETDDDIPPNGFHDRVIATQEQSFLKSKYESIKKERESDPRSHFQINSKTHSTQAIKFANGTLASDKNGMPLTSPSLNQPGVEEEMGAQLAKLAMRDPTGLNGKSFNTSSLSPVELIHFQQQQQQQTSQVPQTPRRSLANNKLPSSISRTNSLMATPGTPGGAQAEKEMLANFFGKLLVKDPIGVRGVVSSSNHQQHGKLPPQSSVGLNASNNTNQHNHSNNGLSQLSEAGRKESETGLISGSNGLDEL